MLRSCLLALVAVCLALCAPIPVLAGAGAIRVVAAENFYGDIAAQLAGPAAHVVSVLQNPDADPHLFEVDIATARAVADADLVIYNGLGYDTWMSRLLSSLDPARRAVVEAAAASHAAAGSNPHLWYDPGAIRAVGAAISSSLERLDPARRSDYAERLARFTASLRPLDEEIARVRARHAGAAVAATEPVADYLVAALGLDMRERRFQLAVENGTEPSAADTAAFEKALRRHEVRVLIYNPQASSTAVERLLGIAREARVPVVGMTETEPRGLDYQQWMLGELRALGRALGDAPP